MKQLDIINKKLDTIINGMLKMNAMIVNNRGNPIQKKRQIKDFSKEESFILKTFKSIAKPDKAVMLSATDIQTHIMNKTGEVIPIRVLGILLKRLGFIRKSFRKNGQPVQGYQVEFK